MQPRRTTDVSCCRNSSHPLLVLRVDFSSMGREPTSTGCHTCRRRHIKYDGTRPSCRRRQWSGYTCDSYESILRIQIHAVNFNTTTSTSHPRKTSCTSPHPNIQSGRTQTDKGASRNPGSEAPLQVATLRSGLVQCLPNLGARSSRGASLSPHELANFIAPLMQEPSPNQFAVLSLRRL